MTINLKIGDLVRGDDQVIAHQVNCQGVMNSGVAKTIRQTYPDVFEEYQRMCSCMNKNTLMGQIQIVHTPSSSRHKYVCNIFAQYSYGYDPHVRYTSYDALDNSLRKLAEWCRNQNIKSVGFPYHMSCGYGNGDWKVVKTLIENAFNYPLNKTTINFYKLT